MPSFIKGILIPELLIQLFLISQTQSNLPSDATHTFLLCKVIYRRLWWRDNS